MPTKSLTVAAVSRLKPPAKGQIEYFDRGYPGLALRVSYGGTRSWVYFYRMHGGKLRRLTLGRLPAMELGDARAAWQEARKAVGKGENPARIKPKSADSFAAVADEWLKRDQARNRSYAEVKRAIERDVKAEWESRPITSISRRDVFDLIDGVADRGAVTLARRLHSHLHRLFRWSVGRGIIEVNPVADLPKPGAAVKRDRVLTDLELSLVWEAADRIGCPFGPAVQILILTGARREEIGALRRSEIHGENIELHGSRTKNGQARAIPLSPLSITILQSTPRLSMSEHLFTTTGKTPVSGWSKAKLQLDQHIKHLNLGRPLPAWRFHDLRRTTATGMQRLGVSLQVVEAVLGHVSGSRAGVVGIYQRYGFEPEKKAALDAWSLHVSSIVRPA